MSGLEGEAWVSGVDGQSTECSRGSILSADGGLRVRTVAFAGVVSTGPEGHGDAAVARGGRGWQGCPRSSGLSGGTLLQVGAGHGWRSRTQWIQVQPSSEAVGTLSQMVTSLPERGHSHV